MAEDLGLEAGKDLSLEKRDSRWVGRTESSVREEQLMAASCSRTMWSLAWDRRSSTAESSSESERWWWEKSMAGQSWGAALLNTRV